MATEIATPIASTACRIMLMTPEPVANEDGGSDAGADAHQGREGQANADAGEHHAGHEDSRMLGSAPISVAQITSPPAKRQDAGGHHGGRAEAVRSGDRRTTAR